MHTMIYKHIQFLLLGFFLLSSLKSQTLQSNGFSLQQAVDYALKNSPNALNAEQDKLSAKYKKREFQGIGLPQVSASFDLKDFIKIPVSVLPNFVAPAVYGGLVAAGAAPPDPSKLNPESYDPIQAQFGTKYQATASAQASQLLFSSDYLIGLKAQKELEILSNISINRTKQDLISNVSKAYYNVLVNQERVELLDANIAQLKKLVNDTKAYNQQGFVELIEVERLEVTYNNLVTEREKIDRLLLLGDQVLRFQMGYTSGDKLQLTDSLPSDLKEETLSISKPDVSARPDYQLLQASQRLNELNLKRQRLGYLPTLVAYGSLGYSALRSEFDIFEHKKDWFPTALIGGTFSLNIFDGLQRHNRIQQARIDVLKNQNNIKLITQVAELESNSAAIMYNNAITSLKSQTRNRELAKHIQEVAIKKYQQGVGSNLEVISAETGLKEAETNYFNSVYEAIVAKIDYQKALGLLK
jgi:outer membrane protein